jgi:ribonuclease HIII
LASESWIGTSDAGRSQCFGPLVAAAVVFGNTEQQRAALTLPVGTDSRVRSVRAAFVFRAVEIGPARWNDLIESGTRPDRLRAWAHARAIKSLYQLGAYPNTVLIDRDLDPDYIRWRLRERVPNRTLTVRVSEPTPAAEAARIIAEITIGAGSRERRFSSRSDCQLAVPTRRRR